MSEELNSQNNNNWQQQTIEKIALSSLEEQKKTRKWGILFKSLMYLYLLLI